MSEINLEALENSKRLYSQANDMDSFVGPLVMSTTGQRADAYASADLIIRSFLNKFAIGLEVSNGIIVNGEVDATTDVEPYVQDLLAMHRWWDLRSDILLTLKNSTRQWLTFNESLKTYYTTGIVQAVGTSGAITGIPFIFDSENVPSGVSTVYGNHTSDEGSIYSTEASTLSEYYYQVLAVNAYGNITAASGRALDEAKNAKARRAIQALNSILRAIDKNVSGATTAMTMVSTQLQKANDISTRSLQAIPRIRNGG